MVDYGIDGTFDLYFTEEGKFATVEGRAEFEDDLSVAVDYKLQEVIGGYKDISNAKQKVTLLATRLAKQFDVIDDIRRIKVTEPRTKPETLAVEILYVSGETFDETI